jgi:type IV secretory pathway VirJ component
MKNRPATLVVIEFGASWPRWLDPTANPGDMAVVAQHYSGPPSDLITQVASRVTRLLTRGWIVTSVVLVSNGRADAETAAARSVLARGLLAQLVAAGGGSFALSVDPHYGRRAEHDLAALKRGLEPSAKSGNVTLSIEGAVTERRAEPRPRLYAVS